MQLIEHHQVSGSPKITILVLKMLFTPSLSRACATADEASANAFSFTAAEKILTEMA